MKLNSLLIPSFALCFCLYGCDNSGITSSDQEDSIIYSTSFDSKESVSEWGAIGFSENAPSGGGSGSAYISGGCVYPHSLKVITAPKSGEIAISAWAKLIQVGGGISVRNLSTDEQISVTVSDSTWQHLNSIEWLPVSAGQKLEIMMNSGGFVPGGMLVTQLDISFQQ